MESIHKRKKKTIKKELSNHAGSLGRTGVCMLRFFVDFEHVLRAKNVFTEQNSNKVLRQWKKSHSLRAFCVFVNARDFRVTPTARSVFRLRAV